MFPDMNITTRLARARELLDGLPAVPASMLKAEQAAAAAKVRYQAAREERRQSIIAHDAERSAASMAALERAEEALADAQAEHRAAAAARNTVRAGHGQFVANHAAPMLPIVDAALHELTDALEGIATKLTVLRDIATRHDVAAPRLVAAGPAIADAVRMVRGRIP